jgi:hypothetical protein
VVRDKSISPGIFTIFYVNLASNSKKCENDKCLSENSGGFTFSGVKKVDLWDLAWLDPKSGRSPRPFPKDQKSSFSYLKK